MIKDGDRLFQLELGSSIKTGLLSESGGSENFVAIINFMNENFFEGTPRNVKIYQVFATGVPFVSKSRIESDQTFGQLEMTFNDLKQNQKGETETNFVATFTSKLSGEMAEVDTFNRLDAKGQATFKIDLPKIDFQAEFDLESKDTPESAKVRLEADVNSWKDFAFKAQTNQNFNFFPFIELYGLDIVGDLRDKMNPKLKLVVTRDDDYTEEVIINQSLTYI